MRTPRITVGPDRVDVILILGETEPTRTSADASISRRALELLPGLADHRCGSRDDRRFAAEITDTEAAHLFEHVVVELMALAGSPRSLRGETSWDSRRDGRRSYRLSIEYDHDIVCIGAIASALRLMGYVLGGGARPDVDAEITSLAAKRADQIG